MKQYILGIDVGTTGTKTYLFSTDGELIGNDYQGYPISNPEVGYSEQNPEDWWNAILKTVRTVCAGSDISQNVVAIAMSTQGGTVVPVDDNCKALHPAVVWNDSRCAAQHDSFMKEVGGDDVMYGTTGWHLADNLPALTIRWFKENKPEVFEKTKYFLTVPDYISMKMTGIPAVDLSNAGINQLCNIKTRKYEEKILAFSGIQENVLPKLVPSCEKIGSLTEDAARELGLSTKTLLVSGAHDQYAVALGAGATKPGNILIGSGTCWVVTAIDDEPDFSLGLCQSVAASPDAWGSLQSLSSGGICLDWLRRNICAENDMAYDVINREAASRKAAEDGLFFFPFSGKADEKTNLCRASFIGMDLSHDKFHLALAVMEGVVFQILWMMESFKAKPGEDGIILAGGASKSPFWSQLLADISGLPVRVPQFADLACVGAAIMAGAGAGVYPTVEAGYRSLAVNEQVLKPDLEKTKKFAPLFEKYKQIAGFLK